jgi:hypothetical protein
VTCPALTVNVALVRPAATTTLFGTVARTVLLLDSVTTALPVGAADCKVTVAVDDAGPTTVDGFSVTEVTAVETTRKSVVLTVVPAADPDTTTPVVCVTALVSAVNGALVAPAGTVTLAGTRTSDVFALDSVTTTPPAGAAPLKLTVPGAADPPGTLPPNETAASSGNSVMSAATVADPSVAEMRTVVVAVTALVPIANVAEV